MRWGFLVVPLMTALLFAQQPLRFEVASVKPGLVTTGLIRASKSESGSRITYRNISLRHLILDEAFGLTEYQLKGPSWLSVDWFDIEVRKPAGTTQVQVRQMMQTLLTERFHLVSHFEEKTMAAYTLTAGNDRGRLHPAGGAEKTSGCPVGTMDDYARIVEKFLQKPVLNQTGISGAYRLRFVVMSGLSASPGGLSPPPPPPPPNLAGCPGWDASEIPSPASSAVEAAREQMGLTLRQAHDARVRLLVIDRIDRDATPN
jgi:uncharacterized protein (TIGR03435 family)